MRKQSLSRSDFFHDHQFLGRGRQVQWDEDVVSVKHLRLHVVSRHRFDVVDDQATLSFGSSLE